MLLLINYFDVTHTFLIFWFGLCILYLIPCNIFIHQFVLVLVNLWGIILFLCVVLSYALSAVLPVLGHVFEGIKSAVYRIYRKKVCNTNTYNYLKIFLKRKRSFYLYVSVFIASLNGKITFMIFLKSQNIYTYMIWDHGCSYYTV